MSVLSISPQNQYKAIDKLTTIAVAIGTHSLLNMAWKNFTKNNPPESPTDPDVKWSEAFMWGAATGLGIGLSKVLMKIIVDTSWKKFIGPKPAEVQHH